MPPGWMHSAAATIGEITAPVRGSRGKVPIVEDGVGFISDLRRHVATKAASRE